MRGQRKTRNKPFRLKDYRGAYLLIKSMAWITFLTGLLATLDYYMPANTENYKITALEFNTEKGLDSDMGLIVHTKSKTFSFPLDVYPYLRPGMTLLLKKSHIFGVPRSYEFYDASQWRYTMKAEGLYNFNGLFPKLLLLSIFSILYRNPRYWMVGLVFINFVIALIISGIPPQLILWLLVAGSLAIFIINQIMILRRQNTKKQN